jgi:hypothetical protein
MSNGLSALGGALKVVSDKAMWKYKSVLDEEEREAQWLYDERKMKFQDKLIRERDIATLIANEDANVRAENRRLENEARVRAETADSRMRDSVTGFEYNTKDWNDLNERAEAGDEAAKLLLDRAQTAEVYSQEVGIRTEVTKEKAVYAREMQALGNKADKAWKIFKKDPRFEEYGGNYETFTDDFILAEIEKQEATTLTPEEKGKVAKEFDEKWATMKDDETDEYLDLVNKAKGATPEEKIENARLSAKATFYTERVGLMVGDTSLKARALDIPEKAERVAHSRKVKLAQMGKAKAIQLLADEFTKGDMTAAEELYDEDIAPLATEETVISDPDVPTFFEELMAKAKEMVGDPAVQAVKKPVSALGRVYEEVIIEPQREFGRNRQRGR